MQSHLAIDLPIKGPASVKTCVLLRKDRLRQRASVIFGTPSTL